MNEHERLNRALNYMVLVVLGTVCFLAAMGWLM